jgi:hypothetical protein
MSHDDAAVKHSLPGGGRDNARFRAVARVCIPEASALDEGQWRDAEGIVARALAGRPASVRRQIALFMRVLDGLALVRHGRVFAALPADRATRLLESLSRSRLLLMRRGVWGVRTRAFMGYYARADAARAIGYRAAAAGWSARGESGVIT